VLKEKQVLHQNQNSFLQPAHRENLRNKLAAPNFRQHHWLFEIHCGRQKVFPALSGLYLNSGNVLLSEVQVE
jgi:hypothetical protein